MAQGFQRAGGNKHADAAALVQEPFLHQAVDALGRRGRVDVEGAGQLIGAGHRGFRGVLPPQDAILQQLRDLLVDQALVVEHPFQGIAPFRFTSNGCVVHYLCN